MQWHLAKIWEVIATTVPDAPAVIENGARRSWRDYEARAACIAAGLAAAGLGPDAKVAIYAFNSTAYLEAQFGALKARCVPINVNYRYRAWPAVGRTDAQPITTTEQPPNRPDRRYSSTLGSARDWDSLDRQSSMTDQPRFFASGQTGDILTCGHQTGGVARRTNKQYAY